MRFQSSLLVLALMTTSLGISQAAPVQKIVPKGAVSFKSKEQSFAVWLPAQRARVSKGLIIMGDLYRPATAPLEFRISAVKKYPRRRNAGNSTLNPLDLRENFYVIRSEMKLQGRQSLQLNGFEGRELRLISPRGPNLRNAQRVRFFDTPGFFYQILVVGSQLQVQKQAALINRVFDSFRILPQVRRESHQTSQATKGLSI